MPEGPLPTTLRVGTVRSCRLNERARPPALVLEIDLGPHGIRTSSARLTERYAPDTLIGRQLVVATDLGSRRIAGVESEVLVLGVEDEAGRIAVLQSDGPIPNGALVH